MELIFLWGVFAVLSALAAAARGRSGLTWFFLGLIFGVFALIAVLVMAPVRPAEVSAVAAGLAEPPRVDLIKRYRGVEITRTDQGVCALGVHFPGGLLDAERAVDRAIDAALEQR